MTDVSGVVCSLIGKQGISLTVIMSSMLNLLLCASRKVKLQKERKQKRKTQPIHFEVELNCINLSIL